MATGGEIPVNIINGLLSARKYATERVELQKRDCYPEK